MTRTAIIGHAVFCLSLASLSAITVWLMTHIGAVDVPGERSSHVHPTPKGGGVGIVLAFLAGIVVLYRYAEFSRIADPYFRAVMLAAIGIAVVAFFDDRMYWPAWVKLLAQVGAALIAVGGGLSLSFIRLPGLGTVRLGLLSPIVTVVWIVAATNAMNFIDGLNGLAGGVTAIACIALAAIGVWLGAYFLYFSSLVLLSGIVGFLPFNFPHAKIFMGDVGSQFCGFMLAVLAVTAGRFEAVDLSVALVPMLLNGVLFDFSYTLLRRYLAGERLTQAHRTHLYQLAQRSGLPATRVTLLHWGFAGWGGLCCGMFLIASPVWKPVWVLAAFAPQAGWLAYVDRRTVANDLPRAYLRWTRRSLPS